jgi:hypothetical protein
MDFFRMMPQAKVQHNNPFLLRPLSLPPGRFGSRETTLYSTEPDRPLILGKAPSIMKLDYRPIDSVLLSALSSFLVQLL